MKKLIYILIIWTGFVQAQNPALISISNIDPVFTPPSNSIHIVTNSTGSTWEPYISKSGDVLKWTANGEGIGTIVKSENQPIFDFSGATGDVDIYVESTDNFNGLSIFWLWYGAVTNVTFPMPMTSISNYSVRGNTGLLNNVDLSDLPNLTTYYGDDVDNSILDISNNPLLSLVQIYSNQLTSSEQDNIMITLDGNGVSNGNLYMINQLGGHVPTSASYDAYQNLIAKGWTIDIPSPPPAFDSSYLAIINEATTNGYTLPSAYQQEIQNQLVLDLKSNGIWDAEDVIYIAANDGSADFARLNWKDPTQYELTIGGTVTWTENEGFRGDGTTGFLNTGFHPGSGGPFNFVQDDASVSIFIVDQQDFPHDGAGTFFGNGQYTGSGVRTILRQNGSSNLTIQVNSTVTQTLSIAADGYFGMNAVVRSLAGQTFDNQHYWRANATGLQNDNASAAFNHLTFPYFIGASNYSGGAGTSWSTALWSWYSMGSSQVDKQQIKSDLIDQYMSELVFDPDPWTFENKIWSIDYEHDLNESNFQDMAFVNNGNQLWTIGATNDKIVEYNLTTPYDLNGMTIGDEFVVSGNISVPTSLIVKDDGLKVWVSDYGSSGTIAEYTLTTPFDLTTMSFSFETATVSSSIFEMNTTNPGHPDYGRVIYTLTGGNQFRKFILSTPWDLSSMDAVGEMWYYSGGSKYSNFGFNDDGSQMYGFIEDTGQLNLFDLAVPYDPRSGFNVQSTSSPYTANLRAGLMVPGIVNTFWLGGAGSNVEIKQMTLVDGYPSGNAASISNEVDGVGSWNDVNGTISSSTEWSVDGDYSLKMVDPTAAGYANAQLIVPVENGVSYEIKMTCYGNHSEAGFSSWTGFVTSPFQSITTTPTEYTFNVTGNITGDAVMKVFVSGSGAVAGDFVFIDKVTIKKL